MFKLFLISIVVAPVLVGVWAGSQRGRRGLVQLLALIAVYDVLYLLLLCYLRIRWIGWGTS